MLSSFHVEIKDHLLLGFENHVHFQRVTICVQGQQTWQFVAKILLELIINRLERMFHLNKILAVSMKLAKVKLK